MEEKKPMDAAIQKSKKSKAGVRRNNIPAPPFHDFVGAKLKSYYAQIASEPVPDRFTELLKQLDARTEAGKKKT
jgi:Anti-sigma factor NepR